MMTEVDEDTIPRNNRGHLIVNGAGAVSKKKVRNGVEAEVQRFISNLIPINDFQEIRAVCLTLRSFLCYSLRRKTNFW